VAPCDARGALSMICREGVARIQQHRVLCQFIVRLTQSARARDPST
jgi:hypothetical protein